MDMVTTYHIDSIISPTYDFDDKKIITLLIFTIG